MSVRSTIRSMIFRAGGALSRPRRGEGLLYYSQTDRALHLVDDAGTVTALGAGGGGLTSPVAVADGGTGATTAATARSNLGIGTAGRGVVATAQAITAGTTYEMVTRQGGRYLRTKRVTDFPTARTVAAASPEYGWTWLNRTALDAANENTTTANALRLDHGNTSTDWNTGGTQTGPARFRTYPLPVGRTYVVTARIACNADQTFEYMFIHAWSTTAAGNLARIGPGYSGGGGPHIGGGIGTSSATVGITTGQRDAGVWVRMIIDRERVDLAYSTSSSSTPPTAWTYLLTQQGPGPLNWGAGGLSINIGLVMITVNTSNTFTADVLYYDVQAMDDTDVFTDSMSGLLWASAQFDATGAEQLIVDDLDLGSDAPTVDNTRLRAILADLENRLPGDSATVTWSYKTGAGTGASSGTFRAAGSVVDDGAGGRYLRLWCKITSDGNTQGSIGPFPFFIPTS